MGQTRYYPEWGKRAEEAAKHLLSWFEMKGYETQLVEVKYPRPGWVVQVRERFDADWKQTAATLSGYDTAASVTFIPEGEVLKVSFGTSKWLEKAAVAGVGYVALPVLMIPAFVGFFRQRRLLQELEDELRQYMEAHPSPARG